MFFVNSNFPPKKDSCIGDDDAENFHNDDKFDHSSNEKNSRTNTRFSKRVYNKEEGSHSSKRVQLCEKW